MLKVDLMKQGFILLFFSFLLIFTAKANNVRVVGDVETSVKNGAVFLSFNVAWDNAWNDAYNWDAVWAFVKYRPKESAGAWKHVYLANEGNTASGVNLSIESTEKKNVGAFLFPQLSVPGNVPASGVTLAVDLSNTGISAADITDHKIDFIVSLIEMVLVPRGPYYLGDGSTDAFHGGTAGDPVLIEDEYAKAKIGMPGGGTIEIGERFPKGFGAFYMMKYEMSQEQFATFLNLMSRDQQLSLLGVHFKVNLDDLKSGDFLFGNKKAPSARNGIVVLVNEPNRPAIFAANLSPNVYYNSIEDGQNIACNYMTPAMMQNYADWTGLRPMSELEFEKACRRPYPTLPVQGEFAWNTTVAHPVSGVADIVYPGTQEEHVATKNVNCKNTIGPVRCGAFAGRPVAGSLEEIGASCVGAMEMSGNLREICYAITSGYSAYKSNIPFHGDGELNASGETDIPTSNWPGGMSSFIAKGGGFTSELDELRVSDRSKTGYLKAEPDSTVGFRLVRTASVGYVDPGRIMGANGRSVDTICQSPDLQTYQIENHTFPSFGGNEGVHYTYRWYQKVGTGEWTLINGESSESLTTQQVFANDASDPLEYVFKREVVCPAGAAASENSQITVRVVNSVIDSITDPGTDMVDGCNQSKGLTIRLKASGTFVWKCGTTELKTSPSTNMSTYKAKKEDFADLAPAGGPYTVTCEVSIGKCSLTKTFEVSVDPAETDPRDCPCGVSIPYGNDVYPTVEIGTQCWMTKNLNIGAMAELSNTAHYKPNPDNEIYKWCYGDDWQNCEFKYGGLYQWWTAVCGGPCKAAFPPNAGSAPPLGKAMTVANLTSWGVKYNTAVTQNGLPVIQGICPEGWHIPTHEDWKTLEAFIGMNAGDLDLTNTWNRPANTDSLKFATGNWCKGGNCNKLGFSALYGGHVTYNTTYSYESETSEVHWWSTTYTTGSGVPSVYVRGLRAGSYAVGNHSEYMQLGTGNYVRCIKD